MSQNEDRQTTNREIEEEENNNEEEEEERVEVEEIDEDEIEDEESVDDDDEEEEDQEEDEEGDDEEDLDSQKALQVLTALRNLENPTGLLRAVHNQVGNDRSAIINELFNLLELELQKDESKDVIRPDPLSKFNMYENLEWTEYVPTNKNKEEIPFSQRTEIVNYDHKLWLFGGGTNRTVVFDHFYTFDLITHEWKVVPQQFESKRPEPRWGHRLLVYKDNIWIFGGHGKLAYLNDLWRYEFKTNQFVQVLTFGSQPGPRSDHTFVALDNLLYLYGGWDGKKVYKNSFYKLDLYSMQWEKISGKGFNHKEFPLTLHVSCVYNKEIYFSSGKGLISPLRKSKVCCYNPTTNQWRNVPILGGAYPPRRSVSASCVFNDKWFVYGGYGTHGDLNDLHYFDFKTQEWVNLIKHNNKELSRFGHDLIPYDNVLITGFGLRAFIDKKSKNDITTLTFEYPIVEELIDFFDNVRESVSDIKFMCADKKYAFGNSAWLNIRLEQGCTKIEQIAKLFNSDEIEILLYYFYTGRLRITDYSQIPILLKIAQELKIDRLVSLCKNDGTTRESSNTILIDLERLYNDEKSKTFSIIVKEKPLPIHPMILAARSELYRGLFLTVNDFGKSVSDLSNRSYKAIHTLVKYCYLDTIQAADTAILIELLGVVGYYGLKDSKFEKLCSKLIIQGGINCENAIQILELAEIYEIDDLLNVTQKFIRQNFNIIKKQKDYLENKNSDSFSFLDKREKTSKKKNENK
ncbi:hypothetical protein M0812_28790 [Anaeramoeba flamelloides]|uniref:BTB domain-containing protein n=1 Tax=Anaeramoeba flamelloides TaxID=1746091 RepID=A0AAV7YBS5_9EUKA|nr:hypothetical protein M0812_28790 [Anaeramoeba flamelloides]